MSSYSAYAEKVAAEVRAAWAAEWNAKVAGKRSFVGLGLEEKTIYCMKGLRAAAYTITDRTSGLIVDCETIEQAREEFKKIQSKLLSGGYWKIAAC
jgi:hypothetical protein